MSRIPGKNRWITDAERDVVATDVAERVRACGWGAKPWHKGTVCRVYVTRGEMNMGYITVFEDGWIRGSLQGDAYYHFELDAIFQHYHNHNR